MSLRAWIVAIVALTSCVTPATGFAQQYRYAGPRTSSTLTLKIEPSYVDVGDTAEIVAAFTPSVEIKNLYIDIWLPPALRIDPARATIRVWREKVSKGETVVVSGQVLFREPGDHMVGVLCWQPYPGQPGAALERSQRDFWIGVPGGVGVRTPPEEKLPSQFKEAPNDIADVVETEESLLHFTAQAKAARDTLFAPCHRDMPSDSIVTTFVTLPQAGDTVWTEAPEVIAYCDMLFYARYKDEILYLTNWRVVPDTLGSIIRLPGFYRVRFTAGPAAGEGKVLADLGGAVYAWPIKVIENRKADLARRINFVMPHLLTLKLEPSHVTPGSKEKLTGTFSPSVDVESLYVSIWLPPEVRIDPNRATFRVWRTRVSKGEKILVTGQALFPKPGVYLVHISYRYPDPQLTGALRAESRNFPIRVPGGLITWEPRTSHKMPFLLKDLTPGMIDSLEDGTASYLGPHGRPGPVIPDTSRWMRNRPNRW